MIDRVRPAEVAAEGGVRARACIHAGAIARVTRFFKDALHVSRKLPVGADEALRGAIADSAWREIGGVVPRDRRVEIAFEAGKVAVTLHPTAPEANA